MDVNSKPRVIITTDSEIDDKCSMLRFLLYTSDVDVQGIVSVNSKWQKDGHGEIWIHEMIDNYATVHKNLLLHNPAYPDPHHLHSVTWQGMVDRAPLYAAGPPYRDTKGSDLIIDKLLDDDPRPLYVSMWGGGTMVAHALWRIRHDFSPADFEKAAEKARLYFIDYQEFGTGGGKWLRENMPQVQNILDYQFCDTWNYRPRRRQPHEAYMGEDFLVKYVKSGHGPLGSEYYVMGNGLYVSEGDTPSYLWLVDNGLRSHERPDFGGWGGRHRNIGANQWNDAQDDGDDRKPLWRWTPATQNDWAARLDWCVKPYAEANHPPQVALDGPLDRTVSPGETVRLDASATADPDGNDLTFSWWQYHDAGTVQARIGIDGASTRDAARFTVPNEPGRQIHVICEVTDNGEPPLTRYRRLIFSIK